MGGGIFKLHCVHVCHCWFEMAAEMSMTWEPDRRSNFNFFSPPAHLCLCGITCLTEILLIVMLRNQYSLTYSVNIQLKVSNNHVWYELQTITWKKSYDHPIAVSTVN